MDKRIIKTKKNIKSTFIQLLSKDAFENITVTDICRAGETSRITFYNYYEDKYSLVQELYEDYIKEALDDYHELQKQNNPQNDDFAGYINMLNAILNLCESHVDFFSRATAECNPYLYSGFYSCIFRGAKTFISHHHNTMQPKYSPRHTIILLCNGLWGIISETLFKKSDFKEGREVIVSIYKDILNSDIFIRSK